MNPAEKAARHYRSGLAAYREGRLDEAVRSLRRAIDLSPANTDWRYDLGVMLQDQGDLGAAAVEYRRVLRMDGDQADALSNLAMCLLTMGKIDEAQPLAAKAAQLASHSGRVLHNLGVVEYARGRPRAAVATLRRAAELEPASPAIHNDLGEAHLAISDYPEAEACFARALEQDPTYRRARANRGVVLSATGRLAEAEVLLRALVADEPSHVAARDALAMTLTLADRAQEALEVARCGLDIRPHPDLWFRFGSVCDVLGAYEDALAAYREAARLHADRYGDARMAVASALLRLGRFGEGWAAYSARARAPDVPHDWRSRRLGASDLEKQMPPSVTLIGEYGLGDELLFLRFAHRLRERGMKLEYWGGAKLRTMLMRTGVFSRVHAHEEPPPAADRFAYLGDLPLILGDRDDAPRPAALSLVPEAERVERFRALLAASGPPPYIGLTWQAGVPTDRLDALRRRVLFKRVTPAALASVIASVGGTAVIVQRNLAAEELSTLKSTGGLGGTWANCSWANDDLEDLLALMAVLDEYVGVSNTAMHLRASVGRCARVLAPMPSEWRWQSGAASTWFPGFALYRQTASTGWNDAFARLRHDLEAALKDWRPG
jgi:tetratricopeptide (TPR) repeat protein